MARIKKIYKSNMFSLVNLLIIITTIIILNKFSILMIDTHRVIAAISFGLIMACIINLFISLTLQGVIGSALTFLYICTFIYSYYFFGYNLNFLFSIQMQFAESSFFNKAIYYLLVYFPQKYMITIISLFLMIYLAVLADRCIHIRSNFKKSKFVVIDLIKRLFYKSRYILLLACYLVLIMTVIFSYAAIYTNYHNEYYGNYVYQVFDRTKYDVVPLPSDSNRERYMVLKKESNGIAYMYEEVELNYVDSGDSSYVLTNKLMEDKQYEYSLENYGIRCAEPSYIFIEHYKDGKKYHIYIDKGFNFSNHDKTEGGSILFNEFNYFSTITFFTIGYGDIVPVANEMREMVQIEALTAHLLTALFIPILFISINKMMEKQNKQRRIFIKEGFHRKLKDIISNEHADFKEFYVENGNKKYFIRIRKL